MKKYVLGIIILFSFILTGCSISSNNVKPYKKGLTKKEIGKAKKINKISNYKLAMNYRRRLWKIGIDYIPWKSHLNKDVILMPKLLKFSQREVKKYNLDKYKIITTKSNSFVSKNNIFYLNYTNSFNSIKKIAKIKLINNYSIKTTKSKFKRSNKKSKIKKLSFISKGIKGEVNLKRELRKIFPSEISRYNISNFNLIPVRSGVIKKKGKYVYIPVNLRYLDIIYFFQNK